MTPCSDSQEGEGDEQVGGVSHRGSLSDSSSSDDDFEEQLRKVKVQVNLSKETFVTC